MICNLIASNFVFESFEAKRDFIRERRNLPELHETNIENIPDESDELLVIDAIWEEIDEPDIPEPLLNWALPSKHDIFIECGANTAKNKPCKLDILTCPFH